VSEPSSPSGSPIPLRTKNGENRNFQSGSLQNIEEDQAGIPAQAGIATQDGATSPKTGQSTAKSVIPVDYEIDRQPSFQDKSTMPVAPVVPAVSGNSDEVPAAQLASNLQPSDALMAPVAQPSNPRHSARLQQKLQPAATENVVQRKRRTPK
jgi:hypothetical protein